MNALAAALLTMLMATAAQAAPDVASTYGLTGFGTGTTAGEGGAIVRVTTLASDGEGSLREALRRSGPRIIVFEVGGVIDLGLKSLVLDQPFVTIAGQTAPSPGITLIRGGLEIRSHDVLMQHIRFRMGDGGLPPYTSPDFGKGWDVDVTTNGRNAYNIVIDHCSFAWAVDENLSVSGPRYDGPEGTSRRVTLSNNIIAEGLLRSTHSKREPHSKGTLIHDMVSEVAVVGNLYAHNDDRNPMFKGGASGAVVNNLIYNPGRIAISAGAAMAEWEGRTPPPPPRIAVAGNHLLGGADSRLRALVIANVSKRYGEGPADVWFDDNRLEATAAGALLPEAGPLVRRLEAAPVWPEGLRARPVGEVKDAVLAGAGARPLDRDAVDQRIVAEVREGRGRIVDSQNEVGGYPPTGEAVRRPLVLPAADIGSWLRRLSDALIVSGPERTP
ncbi:polysaccharide lyase family 1 protein [Uliginosibacterium paludis]|uniref:Pectate lyase n=1 Tax=Uliginosibacterium paludis TaxID=1615952 RepID=A0ABV2CQJ7_9RHOO